MSTTSEAESDDVAKKIATMTTTRPEISVDRPPTPRSWSKNVNIAVAGSSSTAAVMGCGSSGEEPMPSSSIADQPKITNHTSVNSDGATSTPPTNSRIVRPREMRARKMPMNGAQVTVHAQ